MDPATISLALQGAQIVGGLLGGLGASNARRQAAERARKALADMLASADAGLAALHNTNSRNLYGTTGQARDAIRMLAADAGANAASAGRYNSTDVLSLISRAQDAAGAQLADLGARQSDAEAQRAADIRQWVAQQQYGAAQGDLAYSQQQEAANQQSLINGIVGLAGTWSQKQAAAKPKTASGTPTAASSMTGEWQGKQSDLPSILRTPQPITLDGVNQIPIQTFQQAFRRALSVSNPRGYGYATNGMQGSKPLSVPPIRLIGAYSQPALRLSY